MVEGEVVEGGAVEREVVEGTDNDGLADVGGKIGGVDEEVDILE